MSGDQGRLRYVVLRHEGIDDPHFDVMLQLSLDAPLRTWRSTVWPLQERAPLVALPDHRAVYLDYEGPLSGGRGHVRRVAAGTFELVRQDRTTLVVRFDGSPDAWTFSDTSSGSIAIPADFRP